MTDEKVPAPANENNDQAFMDGVRFGAAHTMSLVHLLPAARNALLAEIPNFGQLLPLIQRGDFVGLVEAVCPMIDRIAAAYGKTLTPDMLTSAAGWAEKLAEALCTAAEARREPGHPAAEGKQAH